MNRRIGLVAAVAVSLMLWATSDLLVVGAGLQQAHSAMQGATDDASIELPADGTGLTQHAAGLAGWEAYGEHATDSSSAVRMYNLGVLHHQMGELPEALANWRGA
jgi:hypothetical protein